MKYTQYDVRPTAVNKGLIIKSEVPQDLSERELKRFLDDFAVRSDAQTKRHLTVMQNYQERGIHAETSNGLTLVGPASADANSVVGQAHNAAMAELEEKLADVNAKIAALAAAVAVLEGAKK